MTDPTGPWATAGDIAAAVAKGEVTAREVTLATLSRIERIDPVINAFTHVTAERAIAEAEAVDAARARDGVAGPLAGVPFAVKNLFDVKGLSTVAGSKINRDLPRSAQDGELVKRMSAQGAILVGALTMGEYAYDFTGENAHYGACRNPHDPARMTGGSSSGCGAATAAGLAPVSLGSDTNGSIRVPSSLCGIFGLKPTYGRLTRAGTFPFVDSLDHLGPFARSARDLALAYDAMQGPDPRDHACAQRPVQPAAPLLDHLPEGLRVGIAGGWFLEKSTPVAQAALCRVTDALRDVSKVVPVELSGVEAGRAAAYVITNSESASFHQGRLATRPEDFDPDTRDRFLAGALLPATWAVRAQRVRKWWLRRMLDVFRDIDILLAPATPVTAPLVGQKTLEIGGQVVPLRPNLGLMAQPFSCVGLPVVTVPVFQPGKLPIGVQVIAPPWREDLCLRVAAHLERIGAVAAHPPVL